MGFVVLHMEKAHGSDWCSGIADSHILQSARGGDFDIQKTMGDRNGL